MAIVSFSELLPEVLAAAPDCPTPTIVRNLRSAARELCEESECYRVTLENTVVVANQEDVELSLPDATTLVRPVTLTLAGKRLEPYSVTLLDKDNPEWRTTVDEPKYFMRSNNSVNAVRLSPVPIDTYTTNGLRGEVSVKPSRDAVGMDEIFMDRFYTALIDGALAYLLAIPSAPWFSPQTSLYHRQMFENIKSQCRAIADGDDMPKRRLVRYGGV